MTLRGMTLSDFAGVASLPAPTGNLILLEFKLMNIVAVFLEAEENSNREIGPARIEIPDRIFDISL